MPMVKLLIQIPVTMKAKLDALRKEGTTASGLIRFLLEKHFRANWVGYHHHKSGGHDGSKSSSNG